MTPPNSKDIVGTFYEKAIPLPCRQLRNHCRS